MPDSILSWIFVSMAGIGIAVIASQWAVRHATMLASGTSIPPFLLGVTFFAVGTDVPEIANSVMSSLAGHGDLNVGDSVGSVVTQITLILGLLPFVTSKVAVNPLRTPAAPLLTVAGLLVGMMLIADGYLSRIDGLLLIGVWAAALIVLWRVAPPHIETNLPNPTHRRAVHALLAACSLVVVVIGAGAAVQGIINLSRIAAVPEYVISFFGASLGTSLPETVFAIVAMRRGQSALAMGDIFGACLTDATLSIGVGPVIAPTSVTAALALQGSLFAIAAMLAATLLLWVRPYYDRWSGGMLLVLYGIAYLILLR